MKYLLEMTIRDENYDIVAYYNLAYNNRTQAEERRMQIIETITDNEVCTYNKITPIIKCTCGEIVPCHNFTNTCDCGKDYNFNGDLLADRSQWGLETGEHWTDCY